ncbi:MAG: MBL fold metallo-hydrolase [Acidimicrobiia bacterium]
MTLIESVPLWHFQTNTYVIADGRGSAAVVVDAPPDPTGIGQLLAAHDLTPVALLITHGHIDHVGGVDEVASPTVSAYLHPDDVDMARHPREQIRALLGAQFGDVDGAVVNTSFEPLAGGSTLDLAGQRFDVLFTPGHSPGHCCFFLEDEGVLFSGDQLFLGSIGRTDLPGGDYPTLMRSMADEIMPLPEDTRVLPGHGPSTTLAAERSHNPFLQELL